MNRRRAGLVVAVITLALAAVAALAWWWWMAPARQGARGDGPIVVISIDTLRADRLPAYGHTAIRTPHIDRLAADGVLFEQAWAHSPQTLPSHTSLFTSRLPFEHGVRDNIGFTVRDGQRMLQHALADHGYTTAGFVSSYVLRRQTGIHQGFAHYDDLLPAASPDQPLGQVQRDGDDTVGAAIRWIDRQPSSKFFLFVHIYEPHTPYTPPPAFAAADPYDGEVQHADAIIGALLDHLRATGLYDEAAIVLLSDHGEGLGDHGEEEHGIFLYRETIQVPLIAKMPGGARAGTRVAAPVQLIDVGPTLMEIAGASGGPEVRGRSLLPVLTGEGAIPPAAIYAESLTPRYHFGWSELYAITDERYRLIRAPRDELYDLTQDAREQRSIVEDRPQVHAAMRRALDALMAGAEVTAPSSVSDEDRQRLAALGYVGTQSSAPLDRAADALADPKDKIGVLRMYREATRLTGEGRYDEAIARYRALLGDDPGMLDVWLQVAGVYERRGQHAQAVAAYREIIARQPKDPAALTGAAGGYLRMGRLDEARAHAELAVDVAPAVAYELLARVALAANDAAAARRAAALAERADASLPLLPFVEGVLHHRAGRFAEAVPHLVEARRRMATRTAQVPDVNRFLGDALARLDRFGEAEQAFAAELAVFPANIRARAGLAMLYRATGRERESDRAVEELIRSSPTPDAYELAAQLWTMFGDPSKAAAMRSRGRAVR